MSKSLHQWNTDEGLLRWYADGHWTLSSKETGQIIARANPTEQFAGAGRRSDKSKDAEIAVWLEAFELDKDNPAHVQDVRLAMGGSVAGMKAFRQAHTADRGLEYTVERDDEGRPVRVLFAKGDMEGEVFLHDRQSSRDIALQDKLWKDAVLYRLSQVGGDVEKLSPFDRALYRQLIVKKAKLSVDVLARSLFKADSA